MQSKGVDLAFSGRGVGGPLPRTLTFPSFHPAFSHSAALCVRFSKPSRDDWSQLTSFTPQRLGTISRRPFHPPRNRGNRRRPAKPARPSNSFASRCEARERGRTARCH